MFKFSIKIGSRPSRTQFFRARNFFLRKYHLNKRSKNEIEDNKGKKRCRLSGTVSDEIDFGTFDLHRDHSQAWKLTGA